MITEGVSLAERLNHEISFMRSYHYTQTSIDVLQTAALYLESAVDLLNYASELHEKHSDVAPEKVRIACDAMKTVERMLMREFDANIQNDTLPWFNKVSSTVGVHA